MKDFIGGGGGFLENRLYACSN